MPFEISALSLVVSFWSNKIPVWAVVLACIILYAYVVPILAAPKLESRDLLADLSIS